MRVLVLGGTGVAGRSAVPLLVAGGHAVSVHARTPSGAVMVQAWGGVPVGGDSSDPHVLAGWLAGMDVVVDLRVSVPTFARAGLPGAWRDYRQLRGPATQLLAETALACGVGRLLRDTVTLVYAGGGDTWLTEASSVSAPGAMAANLAAEDAVAGFAASGGVGVALRFASFYGPSDRVSRDVLRLARRGLPADLGRGDAWSSALHTDDVGPAIVAALAAPSGVYNVADDEPLRRVELSAVLAGAVGRERVRHAPDSLGDLARGPLECVSRSQRVSSALFRETTGWRPTVPSRRTGWGLAVAAG